MTAYDHTTTLMHGLEAAPPPAAPLAAAAARLEPSLTHLLHRAVQCADEAFMAELADHRLTPRQYIVLVAVAQNEGASQAIIGACTGIDRSTMADISGRLVKRGLIKRSRSRKDARAYCVRLTDSGQRVLDQHRPIARATEETLLAALPATQREALLEGLSALIAACERERGPVREAE